MIKLGIVVAASVCAYQAWIGLHKGELLLDDEVVERW
jgi:hypothetical protein